MPAKSEQEQRMIERHQALKKQREESKAKSRAYYRRLRDEESKVQD